MADKLFTEEELQKNFGFDLDLLAEMRAMNEVDDDPVPGADLAEEFSDAELEKVFGDDPELLRFMKQQRDAMISRDVAATERERADRIFHQQLAERLNKSDRDYARALDQDMTELEREERKASVVPFQKRK